MNDTKNIIINGIVKIVGAGIIIWMMASMAHGFSTGMTHALSSSVGMLPTP